MNKPQPPLRPAANRQTTARQATTEAPASPLVTGVGHAVPHDSAAKQTTGEARYIDDRDDFHNQLHVALITSPHAHAELLEIDSRQCRQAPGVVRVVTANDVPGKLDIGAILPGEPLLADTRVEYIGQPVVAVAADTLEAARHAATLVEIKYRPLPARLCVEDALAHQDYIAEPHVQQRGNAEAAIASAPCQLQGQMHVGGQEHFYLEGQIASVVPEEDGGMTVYASTQSPTKIQKQVADLLGVAMHKVTVATRRMGGAFGGKETQAAIPAGIAAVVARLTGRPTKVRLARGEDMVITGKRHPFFNQYRVGFDNTGRILGIDIGVAGNCGYAPDLSTSIVDRAMFHADNAYYLGDARVTGYRCRTNTASNTAFRGFGGPQGMMAIELVMDDIARHLDLDPLLVRQRNLYGVTERNITHYHQKVEDNHLAEIIDTLADSSDYQRRRQAIDAFNRDNPVLKKGLSLTPVKFGISFTASFLNQAGALIHIYTDGSIHLNHGGTEMGQGLHTKVAQVVAEEFQVDIDRIQITATSTDEVPNTSPTAASSGADLNGKAAQAAARTLKQRLAAFAADHFGCAENKVRFDDNQVLAGSRRLSFDALIELAYVNQISLSSTGYYKTPQIYYDRETASGTPFYYYALGAACSEVLIDTLTGEHKVLRVDILHDVGASLNPAIDRGQVEGGFIQGMGWLTTEELVWDPRGRLLTDGPATYKIPAIGDTPVDFRVKLVENRANAKDTVFHSKAVGEPPLMLAISVWSALRDAIASLAPAGTGVALDTPATPERVLMAVQGARAASAGHARTPSATMAESPASD